MKIKKFTEFLNEFELEGEVHGKPLWNGKDYLDADGNIAINFTDLTEFPCIFPERWDKSFYCSHNQLTSLIGAPREVKGDFYCQNNQLTSLEGAPKKVGDSFRCNNNQLTSLKGAPKKVGGDFWCSDNKLTSLKGAPKGVGKTFACMGNKIQFTKADVKEICKVGWGIYV